jgi:hypothetical protein
VNINFARKLYQWLFLWCSCKKKSFVVICDAIKSIYSLFKPKQNKKLLKIALSVFEEKLDLRKSIFSLCTLWVGISVVGIIIYYRKWKNVLYYLTLKKQFLTYGITQRFFRKIMFRRLNKRAFMLLVEPGLKSGRIFHPTFNQTKQL